LQPKPAKLWDKWSPSTALGAGSCQKKASA
jgi:hypothetical protein